ncbi:receptor-type tyrosine-protein phosphatase R-like isoform X1 [Myxocyprinus asiaticus]|uniref:receptor-type tyrosine-protein phosphatase R-like isoform X1 n=1 Tax=Myxocyprinus asiaticus TaxID=70543 RepID=UPI002223B02D|nr:receptor-type tyrosine-protein phosphatase R-like isoform X1 [Myxocyprinus asiaticus]
MFGRTAFVFISSLLALHITGGISADNEVYQIPHRLMSNGLTAAGVRVQDKAVKLNGEVIHGQTRARIAKLMPAAFLESHFQRAQWRKSDVNFLPRTDHVENKPKSAHRTVTMEEKDDIELYVSSVGASEPVAHEEMIRLLKINTLHHSSGPLATTEASTEKSILKNHHEKNNIWGKDGFYVLVICLIIFLTIFTCLMVLYRQKEKELLDQQLKDPSQPIRDVQLAPIPVHGAQHPPTLKNSMVQANQTSKTSCATSSAKTISRSTLSCNINILHTDSSESSELHCPTGHSVPELKPTVSSTHSPFRMKPVAGLQERRGSNVSLVLDMSVLGSVEPVSCGVITPRERATQEYLQSASRELLRQQLRDVTRNTQMLHAEFVEIPMNFVDQKELDIPNHGSKNRYRTILPNPHSRVLLKTKNTNDLLSSYINANYIRGYLGDERVFIATQGPMINTVNDFWQMAWQEDCPVIVMITKLKEKNEKCVLYWPEKRGIYGKVEVFVNNVKECDHYIIRSLILKHGGQSRKVQHYWYTSWPDHKTPESAGPLLQLVNDVEEDRRTSTSSGPVIVHCSAGIGRTGCFIATTIGCRQLQLEGVVDVLGIVCQLRTDRGGMIQTEEQYEFVHHALSLFESHLPADRAQ